MIMWLVCLAYREGMPALFFQTPFGETGFRYACVSSPSGGRAIFPKNEFSRLPVQFLLGGTLYLRAAAELGQ